MLAWRLMLTCGSTLRNSCSTLSAVISAFVPHLPSKTNALCLAGLKVANLAVVIGGAVPMRASAYAWFISRNLASTSGCVTHGLEESGRGMKWRVGNLS